MRDPATTRQFYTKQLGFQDIGAADYADYLLLRREAVELHFFRSADLDPARHDGQVYIRTNDVDGLYQELLARRTPLHPSGALQTKPWGQREFALLDPDGNLLTFGQSV